MKSGKTLAAVTALAVSAAVVFAGCGNGMNKNAVLVDINKGTDGEDSISLGYGNFYAKYTQLLYDGSYAAYFGSDMWSRDMYGNGSTFEEDVKSAVVNQMEEEYLLKLHAGDYGVALSDDEKKAIDKAAADFMEDNSNKAVKTMGATKEYVAQMLTYATYATKVTDAVKAEAEVEVSDEDAAQRTFTYVLLSTESQTDESGNTVAVTEDDMSKLLEKAQIISNAADFEKTAKDLGTEVSTYSYGKNESSMDAKVIAAADSLQEGQVSGVVRVENKGYYVIRLDKAFDEEATASEREKLEEEQRSEHYQSVVEGWKEGFTWELDEEQWAKVGFDVPFVIEKD